MVYPANAFDSHLRMVRWCLDKKKLAIMNMKISLIKMKCERYWGQSILPWQLDVDCDIRHLHYCTSKHYRQTERRRVFCEMMVRQMLYEVNFGAG